MRGFQSLGIIALHGAFQLNKHQAGVSMDCSVQRRGNAGQAKGGLPGCGAPQSAA